MQRRSAEIWERQLSFLLIITALNLKLNLDMNSDANSEEYSSLDLSLRACLQEARNPLQSAFLMSETDKIRYNHS